MRFLQQTEEINGQFPYDRYFAYLKTIRDLLGENLYQFAADEGRHDLFSKTTLHDAWIDTLTLQTPYGAIPERTNQETIRLTLLGPYHDRQIVLRYYGVTKFTMDFGFSGNSSKRDLLCHELRHEAGRVIHEFLFDRELTMEIHCKDMRYEDILFPTEPESGL